MTLEIIEDEEFYNLLRISEAISIEITWKYKNISTSKLFSFHIYTSHKKYL